MEGEGRAMVGQRVEVSLALAAVRQALRAQAQHPLPPASPLKPRLFDGRPRSNGSTPRRQRPQSAGCHRCPLPSHSIETSGSARPLLQSMLASSPAGLPAVATPPAVVSMTPAAGSGWGSSIDKPDRLSTPAKVLSVPPCDIDKALMSLADALYQRFLALFGFGCTYIDGLKNLLQQHSEGLRMEICLAFDKARAFAQWRAAVRTSLLSQSLLTTQTQLAQCQRRADAAQGESNQSLLAAQKELAESRMQVAETKVEVNQLLNAKTSTLQLLVKERSRRYVALAVVEKLLHRTQSVFALREAFFCWRVAYEHSSEAVRSEALSSSKMTSRDHQWDQIVQMAHHRLSRASACELAARCFFSWLRSVVLERQQFNARAKAASAAEEVRGVQQTLRAVTVQLRRSSLGCVFLQARVCLCAWSALALRTQRSTAMVALERFRDHARTEVDAQCQRARGHARWHAERYCVVARALLIRKSFDHWLLFCHDARCALLALKAAGRDAQACKAIRLSCCTRLSRWRLVSPDGVQASLVVTSFCCWRLASLEKGRACSASRNSAVIRSSSPGQGSANLPKTQSRDALVQQLLGELKRSAPAFTGAPSVDTPAPSIVCEPFHGGTEKSAQLAERRAVNKRVDSLHRQRQESLEASGIDRHQRVTATGIVGCVVEESREAAKRAHAEKEEAARWLLLASKASTSEAGYRELLEYNRRQTLHARQVPLLAAQPSLPTALAQEALRGSDCGHFSNFAAPSRVPIAYPSSARTLRC